MRNGWLSQVVHDFVFAFRLRPWQVGGVDPDLALDVERVVSRGEDRSDGSGATAQCDSRSLKFSWHRRFLSGIGTLLLIRLQTCGLSQESFGLILRKATNLLPLCLERRSVCDALPIQVTQLHDAFLAQQQQQMR